MTHGTASDARPRRRPLGRRRRRLYWTATALLVVALAGTSLGVAVYRSSRPETYRTGERHEEITSRLDLGLPEEAPEPAFTLTTEEAGLGDYVAFVGERTSQLAEDMGPGAAWGDFDRDGDDDLFLVSAGGPLDADERERARSRLYENRGDGSFAEVSDFPETRVLGMAAAWGDFDADGWLDLVLTAYGNLLLFRNEQGRFRRSDALPDREGFWAGASWADFDNDGDLDLYVCGYVRYLGDEGARERVTQQYGHAIPYTLNPASYRPESNLLFRNDGRGGFAEVGQALGVSNEQGRSLGALWHDFDQDGWLDLYVANDISDNVLYLNREGHFEDASHAAWVADYRGAMGLAAGDFDRDGDDDLFVSHWIAQENALYKSLHADLADETKGLRFMDVADLHGLGQTALQRIGWGAEFADFDGDGWLDLVVANGSTFETDDAPPRLKPEPSFLFWNRRGKQFHDLAPLREELATPHVSRGLALSDYDADGDLDILIVDRDTGARLLRNDMQRGNWIQFRLERDGPQRAGSVLGATVVARVGELRLRRTVSSASYLSQSTRTVHFGLGAATAVDEVEVRWPGGGENRFGKLAANAVWIVREDGSAPARVAAAGSAPAVPGPGPDSVAAGPLDREGLKLFWSKQREAMHAMKVDRDNARAITLFREALALKPDHEDSLYYLGNCLAAQSDFAGAFEQFETLTRLNPQSHRAHKRLGTLRAMNARSRSDLEQAAEAVGRALALNPEATGALQVLGEIDLLLGDLEEGRRQLELVCRSNPRSVPGLFLLGYVSWKQGDEAAARDYLGRTREALGDDWKPEGGTAEGDVQRLMHRDVTPLLPFVEGWNGSLEPRDAFEALDGHLRSSTRSRTSP